MEELQDIFSKSDVKWPQKKSSFFRQTNKTVMLLFWVFLFPLIIFKHKLSHHHVWMLGLFTVVLIAGENLYCCLYLFYLTSFVLVWIVKESSEKKFRKQFRHDSVWVRVDSVTPWAVEDTTEWVPNTKFSTDLVWFGDVFFLVD